jgi:hypothetical protein
MWDPTDDKLFQRTKGNEGDSSYTISSMTNEQLLLAVDQAVIFKKNGKWPIDDTVINQVWEKHKSELGDNPYRGRNRAYDLICHEIAKRWHKDLICE